MFTFLEDESDLTFTSKVTVNHPAHGKQQLTAEFAVIEQNELDELIKDDAALLDRVFVGVEGVRDADKQSIEFSEPLKAAMIRRPYVRTALAVKYSQDIQGFRQGN